MTTIAVNGAAGRMGREVLTELLATEGLDLVAAWEAPGHPDLGIDAGVLAHRAPCGVVLAPVDAAALKRADVVVDFSSPEGFSSLLGFFEDTPRPLVCGTTGLTEALFDQFNAYAKVAPVIWAANYSTGVTLLIDLVAQAARTMGPELEVEVVEIHHHHKKDAPSGTALRLAQAAASVRGPEHPAHLVNGRSGIVGARGNEEIGLHALRGGEVVGEHTVYMFAPGERLEFTHRAQSRQAFARGALLAARWLLGRAPGRYDMKAVLGR